MTDSRPAGVRILAGSDDVRIRLDRPPRPGPRLLGIPSDLGCSALFSALVVIALFVFGRPEVAFPMLAAAGLILVVTLLAPPGSAEIVLNSDTLQVATRRIIFRRCRARPRSEIATLRVQVCLPRGDSPPWAELEAGLGEGHAPWICATGYPAEWLETAASSLARTHKQLTLLPSAVRLEGLRIDREERKTILTIDPVGFWRTHWLAAVLFLAPLAASFFYLWAGMFPGRASSAYETLINRVAGLVFLGFATGMYLLLYHSGRKVHRITLETDALILQEQSLIWRRTHRLTWAKVREVVVEEFAWSRGHPKECRLSIRCVDTDPIEYLGGFPRPQLEWIASQLRRGPPSGGCGAPAGVPGGVCQVCGSGMSSGLVRCAQCATPHHAECWDYLGRCSTYACLGTRYK